MKPLRIAILFLLGSGLPFSSLLWADPTSLSIEAFNDLAEGKYNEAIIAYEKLLNDSGENPETFFNLGIAYYRTLRFSSAENSFERALRLKIEDPVFQSHAEYNIGNSLFQQARLFYREDPQRALFYLQESITAFENAVELQSDFEIAQSNLSTARTLLTRLQNEQNKGEDQNTGDAADQPPQETPSEPGQEEESTSSDPSDNAQPQSPDAEKPDGQPSHPENARKSDTGGKTPGEFMEIEEAMMLLDSVEMDEKRITLSNLLEEKESTAAESPDW